MSEQIQSTEKQVIPVKVRQFRSVEPILLVDESCEERGCGRLSRMIVAEQARIDYANRHTDQTHEWAFDNVEGSVIICEGRKLLGCPAAVATGKVYFDESRLHFIGFQPDMIIGRDDSERVKEKLQDITFDVTLHQQ